MVNMATFESNVNYDLGKTGPERQLDHALFESNVNYDLGKTLSLCRSFRWLV